MILIYNIDIDRYVHECVMSKRKRWRYNMNVLPIMTHYKLSLARLSLDFTVHSSLVHFLSWCCLGMWNSWHVCDASTSSDIDGDRGRDSVMSCWSIYIYIYLYIAIAIYDDDDDGLDGPITALDVSHGSDFLVCGYHSGRIVLWDTLKGTSLKVIADAHDSPVMSLLFLKDQKPCILSVDVTYVYRSKTKHPPKEYRD